MPAFETVLSVVERAGSIQDFIRGGAMVEILSEMGDVEFESAIDALDKAKRSVNPEAEVRAALVHLRSAHFAFRKVLDVKGVKRGVQTIEAFLHARNRDVWVSLLRALCYHHLGEPNSTEDCLADAKVAWNKIVDYLSDETGRTVGFFNPFKVLEGFLKDMKSLFFGDDDKWIISYSEMDSFHKKLGHEFKGIKTVTHEEGTVEVSV